MVVIQPMSLRILVSLSPDLSSVLSSRPIISCLLVISTWISHSYSIIIYPNQSRSLLLFPTPLTFPLLCSPSKEIALVSMHLFQTRPEPSRVIHCLNKPRQSPPELLRPSSCPLRPVLVLTAVTASLAFCLILPLVLLKSMSVMAVE